MSSERGRFIVFEGLDGAGTTTQARRLLSRLQASGLEAALSNEPTGGDLGRVIRRILRGEYQPGGPYQERITALLFAADRLDHVGAHVEPLVAAGAQVISDRYVGSSLAYQSSFCDPGWVAELNRYAVTPDLTIFLDVAPELGLERVSARAEARERYEALATQVAVHEAYHRWLAGLDPAAVIIDGALPLEQVTAAVLEAVTTRLGLPGLEPNPT